MTAPRIASLSVAKFSLALLAWYERHGRKDLPWRQNPTPYRVWLAEVMLQQTQVATVLPYYQRFLQRFADINALAAADQEDVLKQWAGLGYYSRARHLHRTAQIIASEHGGRFPATLEQLTALPGIGRSTAGAILAIAFKQRAAILDGNVKRVLARYGGVEGWTGEAATQQRLWRLSENLTPSARVDDYTQAVMDLGATLCTRSKPQCQRCPVMADCIAYRDERTACLPEKRQAKALPTRECYFLLLRNASGQIYLEQKPAPGLWGGLWCFPEYAHWDDLQQDCWRWQTDIASLERQTPGRHTFSHYHLRYTPVLALTGEFGAAERIADGNSGRWADPRQEPPPMPTPIRRLYQQLHNPPEESIS